MFEYINTQKLKDKLLLTIINIVVFGILFTFLPQEEFYFNNKNIVESMYYSLGLHLYRLDFKNVKKTGFILSVFQIIIAYIILLF